MTDNTKLPVVIPARGGSKRLPRKNVLPLAGKPLICWTIESALEADLDARIMVSSDDDEILAIARQYESKGVIAYKRPCRLATDEATTADVLVDSINAEQAEGYFPEVLILLQPTSPLRNADDIRAALDAFRQGGSERTVVSVCEVDHPTDWVGSIDSDVIFHSRISQGKRSQDYDKEYRLNGAVYVVSIPRCVGDVLVFKDPVMASIMPKERSLDIDDAVDFKICDA